MTRLKNFPRSILSKRRSRLSTLHPSPILLWSGGAIARNFGANHYPFRASSHFLYFAGIPLANAVLGFENGTVTLYWDEPKPESALWYGEMLSAKEIAIALQVDQVFPLAEIEQWRGQDFATIRSQDPLTRVVQKDLGCEFSITIQAKEKQLAEAIVSLRLQHDESAIAQIREAVAVTVQAHQAGMKATAIASSEAEVRAAIESVFLAHDMTAAYGSIVTVQGEVLHNQVYPNVLSPGDLLLVDAGAETQWGWASDVTRTWPVSGTFSATQKALYEIVLTAHDACLQAIRPGVEYQEVHQLASLTLTEGLVELGILSGTVASLLEQDIQAYFFPHGIGHLLGLDVHDMEDLGDIAGYEPGRTRRDRMGLKFLRLDRPLQENMVVTIEPGFYQIPSLLKQARQDAQVAQCINWDRLAEFGDVRGIRIEDDVRVTLTGADVLTADLPTKCDRICDMLMNA